MNEAKYLVEDGVVGKKEAERYLKPLTNGGAGGVGASKDAGSPTITQGKVQPPKKGQIINGYLFKGGNPNDKNNYEKAK